MADQVFKLRASGSAESLYLNKESIATPDHLFGRELRSLLKTDGPIGALWPDVPIDSAYANILHRKKDFAMPLFVWRTAWSGKAVDCFRDHLADFVEWLPLKHVKGREFYVLHCLRVLDVLDQEKTAITYAGDGAIITSVHQEWMRDVESLEGVPIFSTPETREREAYVSAEFAELIKVSGLRGAAFSPVGLSAD